MKNLLLLLTLCLSLKTVAQKRAMPHGMVYGIRPDTGNIVSAAGLEAFMDKKVRISTTIRGKIIKVTKPKGGWFEVDAGNGKVITAHFNTYNVTLPMVLAGKIVLIQGVAQKKISASGKPNYPINPKRRLIFEVNGLMVER